MSIDPMTLGWHFLHVPVFDAHTNSSHTIRVSIAENLEHDHARRVPTLLYQPFAFSWPQVGIGDRYMLSLAQRFSIATFDPRGVGGSTGKYDWSFLAHVNDLIHVMRALRDVMGKAPHVLAISTSTCPTLRALRDFPSAFASVTLAAPQFMNAQHEHFLHAEVERVWRIPSWIVARLPDLAQLTLALGRTPYLHCHRTLLCNATFYNPTTYLNRQEYPRPLSTYLSAGFAMWNTYSNRHLWDTCDSAPVVTNVPLQIVVGKHDHGIAPVTVAKKFADSVRAPHFRYKVMEQSGHAVHMEEPDLFQRIVCEHVYRSEDRYESCTDPGMHEAAGERTWHVPGLYNNVWSWYDPSVLVFEWQFVIGMTLLACTVLVRWLPGWIARKSVHMGIGTLLIHADLDDFRIRTSIYLATTLTCASFIAAYLFFRRSARFALHFAHDDVVLDPGIVTYLAMCTVCAHLRLPFVEMAPLFFADPMGAIVGRNVRSVRVYGSKTLAGSSAVWIAAYLVWNDTRVAERAYGATIVAFVELFGGAWDNPLIGSLLMCRALLLHG